MVNRILIRMKVVQMLYAYLLTRTEFKIDTDPDLGSADKKFARRAYVDLLLVLLEVTGHNTTNLNLRGRLDVDKKLATSRIGQAMAGDATVKEIVFKGDHDMAVLASVLQGLHDRLADSSVFKEYRRKRKIDLGDEVALWVVLFESIIADDAALTAAFRTLQGYTAVGYRMAIGRIVETLNSYYGAQSGYTTAIKNLETSLDKSYELYLAMFGLIVDLTRTRESQIEAAKTKYLATSEDKNPNMRFVENTFAVALAENDEFEELRKTYGVVSWGDDYVLMTSLLELIMKSPIYTEYMSAPSTDWNSDCEFWRNILKTVIFPSDDLVEALEDRSVYWNDDLQITGTFVLKTIRQAAQSENKSIEFLPQYKDDEDASFGAELFAKTVENREVYHEYIERFVDRAHWDADRLAFMDSVIMITAIAEIVNYPNIPLAVTMNEYVEIANSYSSPKSGAFINGVLFNVVELLRGEGVIVKH